MGSKNNKRWALAIHGGAGNMKIDTKLDWWTDAYKKEYSDALNHALVKGKAILQAGGSALDAVQAAVMFLEDCEWFNAGKGSVYTIDGTIELDASIMDGATGRAGAVAAIKGIKNPITLAKEVMDSPYVMLVGEGAQKFAIQHGLKIVPEEYFGCSLNKMILAKVRGEPIDTSWHDKYRNSAADLESRVSPETDKHGTVGAVALDMEGRLAAGTSTGGIETQIPGRVGDTGNIGAGTYADHFCAVSCTGQGEGFIKRGVAFDVSAKMRYLGIGLNEALYCVIEEELRERGVNGGAISVSKDGTIAIHFNTDSMFRGWASSEGELEVRLALNC